MSLSRATLRRSTKLRRCRCGAMIYAGDQYIEQVIAPDHPDVGNVGWWRDAECRACAVSCGRWPIPNGGIDQRCSTCNGFQSVPADIEGVQMSVRCPECST